MVKFVIKRDGRIVEFDKRKIVVDGDIKAFGSYACEIKLYAGISAKMFVMVGEKE